jgi:hypothetical protein
VIYDLFYRPVQENKCGWSFTSLSSVVCTFPLEGDLYTVQNQNHIDGWPVALAAGFQDGGVSADAQFVTKVSSWGGEGGINCANSDNQGGVS